MTKYGLRTWVFLLTLTPTLLVGLMLGIYFSVARFYEQESKLAELGSNIAEPLAITIQKDLANGNREAVTRLIGALHRKNAPYVLSVAVYSNDNKLFASSNFHRHYASLQVPDDQQPSVTMVKNLPDSVVIQTPVFRISSPLAVYYNQPAEHSNERLGYVVVQLDRARAQANSYSGILASIGIIFVGLLINLIFTMRLMRQVHRPITEMVDAIDRIRRGYLDTHVSGALIGELEVLRNGINDMARSLSDYQSDMQYSIDQATADLRETLEQIEIQNVELDMAKRRAMEASRVKSEFLANMSHELRTPLNGVLGFSRQLLKGHLTPTQHEQIATIENSATNLLSIINDILDFSKLESGKLKLEHLPFVLTDSVEEVTSLLAPSAYQKGLNFILEITPGVPDYLVGDSLRLKQVLTNLVGNAIKFTDQGAVHVRVSMVNQQHSNEQIKISVVDTGIGINAEQQSMLFQPFEQGDSSITRRFGGTGLGLIITKRLVQEMGGEVGVQSEPGKGSTFWATLRCTRSPITLGEPLPLPQLSGMRVMLLEREETYRRVLRELLESWDMRVTCLRNDADWNSFITQDEHYDAILIAEDCHHRQQLQSMLEQCRQRTERIGFLFDNIDNDCQEYLQSLLNEQCFTLRKPLHPHRLCRALAAASGSLPAQITASGELQALPHHYRARVLAVDDNRANLSLIATLLADLINDVDTASNGSEAIQKAAQQSYDMILMDIQMPGIDGLSATAEIRNHPLNASTPIVAVTAHALAEERAHLLSHGMDDYLTKPIEESQLQALMDKWLLPEPKSATTAQIEFPQLDTDLFDWNLALSQSSRRTSIAKEMIQMLLDSLPEAKQQISEAWNAQQTDQLQQQIHKLHGASCYTGTPSLRRILETIEEALKRKESFTTLEPEYLELMDIIEQLLQLDLAQLLASNTTTAKA